MAARDDHDALDGETAFRHERLLANLLRVCLGVAQSRIVSRRLVERFGTLPDVLSTPPELLQEVNGVDAAVCELLATTLEVAQTIARERLPTNRPILSSWSELLTYCHIQMSFQQEEQFRVLFMDRKLRLIADEVLGSGDAAFVPIVPRQILRRAIQFAASGILLIHNHPSGDPSPSSMDVKTTEDVCASAACLGIAVHDHVIVGRSGYVSLKARGLMPAASVLDLKVTRRTAPADQAPYSPPTT